MKHILTFLLFLFFNTLLYAQVDLKEGLVAHYPFNGNANDESGNGNHGQVVKAKLTDDRLGNPNSAYLLNGVSDYIRVPHSESIDLTKDFTISIWFKAYNLSKDPGGHQITLFRKGMVGRETSYSLMFDVKNNIPKGIVTKLNVKKWYNIVVIRNSSENYSAMYINGKLVKSGGAGKLKSNSLPLGIGASLYIGGAEDKFKGVIDEIKIFKGVINECQIASLLRESTNPLSPKETVVEYVSEKISSWQEKDEYETTGDYEKRIKIESTKKEKEFEKYILDSLSKKILWHCGTKKYNADKEEFTLNFNNVEPFQLKVPRKEAREFGDNFAKIEYINPQFSIGAQPNLIVDCITINNPVNGKTYKYGCQTKKDLLPPDAIKVKSKTVTVKIWDDAKEDGDIVSVYLNDARLKKEMKVSTQEHIFTLELKKGINTFKLLAHNEGASPPNTAAILIDDGEKEYQRVLSSKKDEYAILNIVLE